MTHSPFHRIILPALLASSAGFATLTWPLASSHAGQVSEKLPAPLSRWVESALMMQQQKDLSIRYVGFATLSSLALGLGTAEIIRHRQNRADRQQQRLQHLLGAQRQVAEDPARLGWDNANSASLFTAESAPLALTEESAPASSPSSSALDWASLLETSASAEGVEADTQAPQSVPSMPLKHHRLHHLQGANQERYLAIQVEGHHYSYYRRRPTLEKAQALANQLQQQGQLVITTEDEAGYTVWVRWVKPIAVTPPTLITSGWPDPA
ncbi:MAG: hypothetical protein HC929_04425 [Leptolyngbyaceae cyanobacterium SM2_5_2]|nr:hypothetical protein [Leptolyngbyaceae cyanobacterium SM2_5_2]